VALAKSDMLEDRDRISWTKTENMNQGNLLTLPAVPWKAQSVEKGSHNRLLLELYDREQGALKRYLVMLGVDSETASDVVQDGFLKLHEHLLAGGDQSNLRAWLYRVVHNGARNIQTSFGARNTGRIDDLAPAASPLTKDLSAEAQLLGREREQLVREAMAQLSETQRGCLVLRAQGLKYREIAEALDLSISTVGENIQRGLERLRELI
jgi:RNA polymerase sigma-70 factor (ECF subfamily)